VRQYGQAHSPQHAGLGRRRELYAVKCVGHGELWQGYFTN
jgi:hypothetical protein